MRFLRWLFSPGAPVAPDLLERIEILEDGQARLERRFESLRGSVTGTLSRHARRRAQLEAELDQVQQDQDQDELLEEPLEDADLAHSIGARRRFGKGA